MREIIKLVVVLSVICAASASTLQAVRVTLTPIIEKQNDFYVRGPALEALFRKPAETLLSNKIIFKNKEQLFPIFYDLEAPQVKGIAVEAIGKGGYGGDISIMVGIDLQADKIIGMEIIQHSETPGVGARIEKESFRKQWQNVSLDAGIALKKDGGQVDAISGATYSSAAVINGTNAVLELLKSNKMEIMDLIKTQIQSTTDS